MIILSFCYKTLGLIKRLFLPVQRNFQMRHGSLVITGGIVFSTNSQQFCVSVFVSPFSLLLVQNLRRMCSQHKGEAPKKTFRRNYIFMRDPGIFNLTFGAYWMTCILDNPLLFFIIVCWMIKVCCPNWAITFKEFFFSLTLLSVCGACPPTTAQTTQFPGCCLRLLCARCRRPDGRCVGVSWQVFIELLLCNETFELVLRKKSQFNFRFKTHLSSRSKHPHSNH